MTPAWHRTWQQGASAFGFRAGSVPELPRSYFFGFALPAESEGRGGGDGLAGWLPLTLMPFFRIGALIPS